MRFLRWSAGGAAVAPRRPRARLNDGQPSNTAHPAGASAETTAGSRLVKQLVLRLDWEAGQTHRTGFSAPLCLVYLGSVPLAPLTKAEYANRLGVSPSAVSKLIARGKLTESALCDDGRINVAVADRQLHAALNATASCSARNRRRRSRVPALVDTNGARAAAARKEAQDAQAALARAELLARLIGAVENRFFPTLVSELGLTYGQAEALSRIWYLFRRRVSRRVASPERSSG